MRFIKKNIKEVFLFTPRLQLLDQKYSKNCNIVKHYFFPCLYFKMQFNPVGEKRKHLEPG